MRSFTSKSLTVLAGGGCWTEPMRLVRMNRKAVREALADEGWRFTLTDSKRNSNNITPNAGDSRCP